MNEVEFFLLFLSRQKLEKAGIFLSISRKAAFSPLFFFDAEKRRLCPERKCSHFIRIGSFSEEIEQKETLRRGRFKSNLELIHLLQPNCRGPMNKTDCFGGIWPSCMRKRLCISYENCRNFLTTPKNAIFIREKELQKFKAFFAAAAAFFQRCNSTRSLFVPYPE